MFAEHSILYACIIYTTHFSSENTTKQIMFNITCSLQYKITNVSFKAGATARSEKYTVKNWQNLKAFFQSM